MGLAVATEETVVLPAELERRLESQLGDVNMLPAVAMQALEVAKNPECSIMEFSRIIEQDVKLASDILALANSALFCGSAPLSSLHQSIVRLGLRKCKNLIFSSSLTALMQKLSAEDAYARERLWRHSFQSAVLALHVNHALTVGFQGEEFTAALMHDFGRLLLGMCLPERALEFDRRDLDGDHGLLELEQLNCGTDHCELGAWFAQKNRLPESLVAAIRFHHLGKLPTNHQRLIALVAVCDHMASHLMRCGGPEGYDLRENAALPLLERAGVRTVATHFRPLHLELMQQTLADAEQMMNARG